MLIEKKRQFDVKNAEKTPDNKKTMNFSQTDKEKREKTQNIKIRNENTFTDLIEIKRK